MEQFDPNTIARLASRIYNEVPGANTIPKNPTDVVNSNHALEDSAKNHVTSIANSELTSSESLNLDRIKEILSKQGSNSAHKTDISDLYFIPQNKSEASSLSKPAASLKTQQSLADHGKSHSNLKSFVKSIQEDHHKSPLGLFTGSLENCKLFSKSNPINNGKGEIYPSRRLM